jgi:predicted metalloprotease
MQWQGRRRSTNIEDRRGRMAGPLTLGGGAFSVVALLFAIFTGAFPTDQASIESEEGTGGSGNPAQEQLKDFAATVLADTEETWPEILAPQGVRYREPKMVLFSRVTTSACGHAQSASGPFYCPPDERVYLDLSFFDELDRRFDAPGDFAQAYVMAHEVGHHVQHLLGLTDKVRRLQQRASPEEANQISVQLELQADCFAGIWAHHANQKRKLLEPGDLDEGLRAASAVGDDALQKASTGRVVPESFTHGSSAQRRDWFTRGFKTGDMKVCDTFSSR